MQFRHQSAQDAPQGVRRRPEGMPDQPPPRAPVAPKAPGSPPLPVQKPVTDEPEPVAPARWKRTLKRVLSALAIVLALSLTYVFLLMGEPDEDSQLTAQNAVQEETIRVPIAASEVGGNADLNPLAVNFGKPVLALYGSDLPLQKATLFDTAFHGGYARRMRLVYAFPDGQTLTVESLRPTGAVALLSGADYRLTLDSLYAIAGMDAVRLENDESICLLARDLEAAYAVLCPKTHADALATLTKQLSLMQPSTP